MELSQKQLEDILGQFKKQLKVEAAGNCPDEETLAAYIDGMLSAEEKSDVIDHLFRCDRCRHTVAVTAAEVNRSETETGNAGSLDAIFEAELSNAEIDLGLDAKDRKHCRHANIMVVDDDRRYLASLTDTLSTEFSVTPCANGPEALERLDDEVQAIVLDIKMAHMNGLTVAEKVMASHEGIPIIFNTGYPGEYVKEDIENRYHPFGYVTKDDPGKLLDLVRRAADGKDCVPA